MRKLKVFNHVSLDGYFKDAQNGVGWAHTRGGDAEWNAFVEGNAGGGGTLVFGRVTYDMMVSYWPTEAAKKNQRVVAERMNSAQKIVFSRSMDKATWNNTTLIKTDPVTAFRRLKQEDGEDMVMFGSGSIIAQLAPHKLIDEYQFVVDPIVLGAGETMFEGVPQPLTLKQMGSRSFKNGNLLLTYQPA
jgi:dihydrofolate reductase